MLMQTPAINEADVQRMARHDRKARKGPFDLAWNLIVQAPDHDLYVNTVELIVGE